MINVVGIENHGAQYFESYSSNNHEPIADEFKVINKYLNIFYVFYNEKIYIVDFTENRRWCMQIFPYNQANFKLLNHHINTYGEHNTIEENDEFVKNIILYLENKTNMIDFNNSKNNKISKQKQLSLENCYEYNKHKKLLSIYRSDCLPLDDGIQAIAQYKLQPTHNSIRHILYKSQMNNLVKILDINTDIQFQNSVFYIFGVLQYALFKLFQSIKNTLKQDDKQQNKQIVFAPDISYYTKNDLTLFHKCWLLVTCLYTKETTKYLQQIDSMLGVLFDIVQQYKTKDQFTLCLIQIIYNFFDKESKLLFKFSKINLQHIDELLNIENDNNIYQITPFEKFIILYLQSAILDAVDIIWYENYIMYFYLVKQMLNLQLQSIFASFFSTVNLDKSHLYCQNNNPHILGKEYIIKTLSKINEIDKEKVYNVIELLNYNRVFFEIQNIDIGPIISSLYLIMFGKYCDKSQINNLLEFLTKYKETNNVDYTKYSQNTLNLRVMKNNTEAVEIKQLLIRQTFTIYYLFFEGDLPKMKAIDNHNFQRIINNIITISKQSVSDKSIIRDIQTFNSQFNEFQRHFNRLDYMINSAIEKSLLAIEKITIGSSNRDNSEIQNLFQTTNNALKKLQAQIVEADIKSYQLLTTQFFIFIKDHHYDKLNQLNDLYENFHLMSKKCDKMEQEINNQIEQYTKIFNERSKQIFNERSKQ